MVLMLFFFFFLSCLTGLLQSSGQWEKAEKLEGRNYRVINLSTLERVPVNYLRRGGVGRYGLLRQAIHKIFQSRFTEMIL